LLKWRKDYPYEIDGIIVMNDAIYPRPKKNPEYAFAFKMVMSEQVAEAKVVDVLWTPSKDGYIKPRVQIEKITLSGVTIEYATGFNAKFIEEHKIGVGAIITIIRSGDVIPHIVNVVVPAEYVKFPEVKYLWNETHVDIILEDKETNSIVQEKNIVLFFQHLEVTGIGPGTIKRIVASGFNSVPKILAMKESDFLSVTGVKEKTAKKLYENIQSQVTASSLVKLMVASNIFGRGLGEITFTKILNAIPEILTSTENNSIKKIKLLNVEGVATTTADKFILHIPEFLTFIQDAKLQDKLKILSVDLSVDDSSIKSHELYNKQIVLTNFRDKEVIETIKKYGGVLTNSVTKNTFAVIVKETIEEETTKTKMARNLNIPILTKTMFEEKFK
jgi:NAD-dependent DNA ligase